ncbi:hypothetical protein C3920_00270 [Novacetimonas pomaceti]|uniref:Uncharacterized protein n=1 Tax=Novacetimonas pomaceti TaxID=2021998 RepID=A0ABX5P8Y4_9PROT|nr:hypothetical protein C3920_00270 [Novacetimonas pomaceti]
MTPSRRKPGTGRAYGTPASHPHHEKVCGEDFFKSFRERHIVGKILPLAETGMSGRALTVMGRPVQMAA